MKSFVHEASDVKRAIDEAWSTAGKPQLFSVKVIEEGLSTWKWWSSKPAKIIFSYEMLSPEPESLPRPRLTKQKSAPYEPSAQRPPRRENRFSEKENRSTERENRFSERENRAPEKENRSSDRRTSTYTNSQIQASQPATQIVPEQLQQPATNSIKPAFDVAEWSPEILSFIRSWMIQVFADFNLGACEPALKANGNELHIIITPMKTDAAFDRHLASSLAVLILESVKVKFKRAMRGARLTILYE